MTGKEGRCPCNEIVVRGITSAHVDQGKASPDLFSGTASVNRTTITDLSETLSIFRKNLQNPDKGVSLRGHVSLSIHELVAVVRAFIKANKQLKDKNMIVWVEPDPYTQLEKSNHVVNLGHAVVVPKLTAGMSTKLVNHLEKRMVISHVPL